MSPNFDTLPPKIIIVVLENLPDSASLLAAMLTCRHVHNIVSPYIPSILKSTSVSQIITLLHSSLILYRIFRSVNPAPNDFRDLRDQARFLKQTLLALESMAYDYGGDLLPLQLPLQLCDIQCTSIALNILERVQPRDKSIKRWGDILSAYNMTFRVFLLQAKLFVFLPFR